MPVESNVQLTAESLRVFLLYAKDAGNWGGNPFVSHGNIQPTKAMRGNLSDLVQKGLIRIDDCDDGRRLMPYVTFLQAGKQLAKQHGIEIDD